MSSCPRCASPDIFGKKFGFGDVTLHEYVCNACDLFEAKKSTDADFSAWAHSWSQVVPGSRDVAAILAAATPPPMDPQEAMVAVVGAPADDAPRLEYARAIEPYRPERAELIRLQLRRFHAELTSGAFTGSPSLREADILQRFAKEWAGPMANYARPYTTDGKYRGWEFERGFVAQLRTDPDMVADPRGYLFATAPIEHLSLTADGPVRDALASPNLARVRSLDLSNLGLGDDDARLLAAQGTLARMEWLDLRGNEIGSQGVAALLANPQIRAIPIVLLEGNVCDPAFQYSLGYDGRVMDEWLPPEGANAETTYGRIGWLHLPHGRRPDRYHARAVRYAE